MALFNSIMSTSELKCEDSCIMERTNWDYGVECKREWTKSLELCYGKRRLPPKFDLFPFFNDPDTEDQVEIKRNAAYMACNELMLIYDGIIKKSLHVKILNIEKCTNQFATNFVMLLGNFMH